MLGYVTLQHPPLLLASQHLIHAHHLPHPLCLSCLMLMFIWNLLEISKLLVFHFASSSYLVLTSSCLCDWTVYWEKESKGLMFQLQNIFNLWSRSWHGASFLIYFHFLSHFQSPVGQQVAIMKQGVRGKSHAVFLSWPDSDMPWWNCNWVET